MATILDIIMASFIGSFILLSVINANQLIYQHSTILNGDVLVQQMLISNAQIIEGEFRNMGMGVHEDSASVVSALDTAISFLTDLNRDGTPDKIDYWIGHANEMPDIQNNQIRFLHRRVNNGTVQSIGTVTKFRLMYFSQGQIDTLRPPIPSADLQMIKIVEITMEVQNPHALYRDPRDVRENEREAFYSSSYWRQTRLASQNLKR